MVQDVENVDKWGQPIKAHGKEKEVPEAPPSAAELIGFRIINSLHEKPLVVDIVTSLYIIEKMKREFDTSMGKNGQRLAQPKNRRYYMYFFEESL